MKTLKNTCAQMIKQADKGQGTTDGSECITSIKWGLWKCCSSCARLTVIKINISSSVVHRNNIILCPEKFWVYFNMFNCKTKSHYLLQLCTQNCLHINLARIESILLTHNLDFLISLYTSVSLFTLHIICCKLTKGKE